MLFATNNAFFRSLFTPLRTDQIDKSANGASDPQWMKLVFPQSLLPLGRR